LLQNDWQHLTFYFIIILIITALLFTCNAFLMEVFSVGNGKKYVGTISRVWEMAKNAWGRFPECGKWQKMRGDDFLSVGNGKKYVGTVS